MIVVLLHRNFFTHSAGESDEKDYHQPSRHFRYRLFVSLPTAARKFRLLADNFLCAWRYCLQCKLQSRVLIALLKIVRVNHCFARAAGYLLGQGSLVLKLKLFRHRQVKVCLEKRFAVFRQKTYEFCQFCLAGILIKKFIYYIEKELATLGLPVKF